MNESSNSRTCLRCQATLPSDAPEGLCPRCLMALNFASQTDEFGPGGTKISPPKTEPLPVAEITKLFPQFEIIEFLGRGGMGLVYKARQPRLDRFVALKILAPDPENRGRFAERFEREARALAKLSHPHIVSIYDFGESGGFYFLAMEFVDGMNLRELIRTQKMPPEEALAIVPPICDALQFAHTQGVVHRDIKPENILLDKQGRVKIADFGIAKILGTEAKEHLTGEQQSIGTPHYMAPEQVEKPTTVDHRADIYSLGVVFYEMLTGELPLGKFQPPSKKVHIDVRLDEVVLHALEKEPERRYQHASEVKTDVQTIATSPESQPHNAAFPESLSSHELNKIDALLTGTSLLLCVSGLIMGFTSPPAFGIPVAIWGVLGFIAMMRMLFAPRDFHGKVTDQNQCLAAIRTAHRIVLVHAIGICTAGLVVAFKYTVLPAPFVTLIAIACIVGIVVSLLRLTGRWPFSPLLLPHSIFSKKKSPDPRRQRMGILFWLGVIIGVVVVITLVTSKHYEPGARNQIHPMANMQWNLALGAICTFLLALGLTVSGAFFFRRRRDRIESAQKNPHLRDIRVWTLVSVLVAWLPVAFFLAGLPSPAAIPLVLLATAGLVVAAIMLGRAWYPPNKTGNPEAEAREPLPNSLEIKFNPYPRLLPGERVLHFKQWLWLISCKSFPTYRLFFSFPPFWEAGLYVTDRRIIVVSSLFRLFSQDFSIYFSKQIKAPKIDVLKETSVGYGLFGAYLELRSDVRNPSWYRSRKLRLRIFTHEAESLHKLISDARKVAEQSQTDFAALEAPAATMGETVQRSSLRFLLVSIFTIALTQMAVQLSTGWRESEQEQWLIPFGVLSAVASLWAVSPFFRAPHSPRKWIIAVGAAFAFFVGLWVISDTYGNYIVPKLLHPEMKSDMDISFGRSATTNVSSPSRLTSSTDQIIVEDLALQMLVAIRDKEDRKLKSLATDSVKTGWRDALPQFALEMRERFLQMTGKPFTMFPGESLVEGNRAVVKCNGPKELNGIYVVLFFVKTDQGWRNWSLRNSPANKPLSEYLKQVPAVTNAATHAPPVVIQTIPQANASDVDPSLDVITVTFSEPMQDGTWSWVKVDDQSFPEIAGHPRYLEGGRTCVLPVKLTPGKTYNLWLNSDEFTNFRDKEGRSALPYLLIFQTRQ